MRLAGVVRSALALPSVEGNASELLALAFPNVIFTWMRECRSARWEAVISEGPWETLTVQLGATRDVVAACVFATLRAGGGASPVRPVLLCPAFAVARAHRRIGIGSMLLETLRAVALERTCSHIAISCDSKCDVVSPQRGGNAPPLARCRSHSGPHVITHAEWKVHCKLRRADEEPPPPARPGAGAKRLEPRQAGCRSP